MRLSYHKALALAVLSAGLLLASTATVRANFEAEIFLDGTQIASMDSSGNVSTNNPNFLNVTASGSDASTTASLSETTSFADFNLSTVSLTGSSSLPNASITLGDTVDIVNGDVNQHTYTVVLTETGFTNPEGGSLVLAAGDPLTGSFTNPESNESATFQAYVDPNNANYGTTVTAGSQTDTSGGSTVYSSPFSANSAYSLTESFTVTLDGGDEFTGSGTSLVNSNSVNSAPAPSSAVLTLSGLPLLGLLVFGWRRRRNPVTA